MRPQTDRPPGATGGLETHPDTSSIPAHLHQASEPAGQEWRTAIYGGKTWPGLEISTLGKVRRGPRVVRDRRAIPRFQPAGSLRPTPNGSGGYLQIDLCSEPRTTTYIHRLVLETFAGPPPEGAVARHLNGDPRDNRLVNLAWGTPAENRADAVAHGTLPAKGRPSKLDSERVTNIRRALSQGRARAEIAQEHGISRGYVAQIAQGRAWREARP